MTTNMREIEEKSKACYAELLKLKSEPEVIVPGAPKTARQLRIGHLEGAMAAFGLAMAGARR